jgi:hypothetical protein
VSTAPLLPDRREWTVDDLADLPPDLRYELINGRLIVPRGVPTYWVIDPLHEKMTLTELLLTSGGEYDFGVHTSEIFTTDRPWPVALDLPALTERRAELSARADRSRS